MFFFKKKTIHLPINLTVWCMVHLIFWMYGKIYHEHVYNQTTKSIHNL